MKFRLPLDSQTFSIEVIISNKHNGYQSRIRTDVTLALQTSPLSQHKAPTWSFRESIGIEFTPAYSELN